MASNHRYTSTALITEVLESIVKRLQNETDGKNKQN